LKSSLEVTYQVFIGVDDTPAEFLQKLQQRAKQRPTGSVALSTEPFGFSYKADPHIFSFVAIGTSAGMAVLLLEFASHAPYVSYVALSLALLFVAIALFSTHRFLRSVCQRIELVALGSALEYRVWWGTRRSRTQRFSADEIVAVSVVPVGRRFRVVLMGPRHRMLGEMYHGRLLDPDSAAPWFADMIGLVAQQACAALALPSQRPRDSYPPT